MPHDHECVLIKAQDASASAHFMLTFPVYDEIMRIEINKRMPFSDKVTCDGFYQGHKLKLQMKTRPGQISLLNKKEEIKFYRKTKTFCIVTFMPITHILTL